MDTCHSCIPSSGHWRCVSEDDRNKLTHHSKDGEFWMSFPDFLCEYSRLEICNLTPDALTDEYSKWAESEFEDTWRRGVSAGGCRDSINTFYMNPKFVIKLNEVDDDPDDGEEGCTFIVGLMQKNKHRWDLFFTSTRCLRRQVHLKRDFLLPDNHSAAHSVNFINLREVCGRFCLPPGEYLIIPSTFDTNENGDFYMQDLYKEKDIDRSGCMSSSEMRMAVEKAGFSLNNPMHQIIAACYTEPDLSIDFDNFVCCLIRLELLLREFLSSLPLCQSLCPTQTSRQLSSDVEFSLTPETFKILERDGTGHIELGFSQWLYLAMV